MNLDLEALLAALRPEALATTNALARGVGHSLWQIPVLVGVVVLAEKANSFSKAQTRYLAYQLALFACAFFFIFTIIHSYVPPQQSAELVHSFDLQSLDPPLSIQTIFHSKAIYNPVLLVLWMGGMGLKTLGLAWEWLALRIIIRQALTADAAWQTSLQSLSECFRIHSKLRIAQHSEVDSPQLVAPQILFWLRPIILVPLGMASQVPPDVLRYALAHELEHLRRWDLQLNCLQCLAECLLAHHPVIWWLAKKIREERELACDQGVCTRLQSPTEYAWALSQMERFRHAQTLSIAATQGNLMKRIHQLLNPDTSPPFRRPRPIAGLFLCLGLLCSSIAIGGGGIACQMSDSSSSEVQPRTSVAWLPPVFEKYTPAIEDVASEYELDPKLLAILAYHESRGRAEARNSDRPDAARGIMQLTPRTAKIVANQLGYQPTDSEQFMDELESDHHLSLELAAQLLDSYRSQLSSDQPAQPANIDTQIEALAIGYNGGQGQLSAYLEGKTIRPEVRAYTNEFKRLWNQRNEKQLKPKPERNQFPLSEPVSEPESSPSL